MLHVEHVKQWRGDVATGWGPPGCLSVSMSIDQVTQMTPKEADYIQ